MQFIQLYCSGHVIMFVASIELEINKLYGFILIIDNNTIYFTS